MTGLRQDIAALIQRDGPISVARYMDLCLGHPVHGYYMTRDPFGRAGDFTTAPEISQMFGEMLGIWAMTSWLAMGSPKRFGLVELGPGRGTLMADVLRASRAHPAFGQALHLHMVEMSPVLRKAQRATLADTGITASWHDTINTLPDEPLIILANEFFDALPVRQFVFEGGNWRERVVDIGRNGALCFGLSKDVLAGEPAAEGSVRETCPAGDAVIEALARRMAAHGGALLAVDYGHARPGYGDTLQAVQGHRYVDLLAAPGEADITAHVDFHSLAAAARRGGAVPFPVLTQHTLLARLGLETRAAALTQTHPDRAPEIAAAVRRLAGLEPQAMGRLFKALCVAAPGVQPYGFDTPDPLIDNR